VNTSLDPTTQRFLANLDSIGRRLTNAQREISSGKRIGTPSDAPDQIGELLQLRADLAHNTQIGFNLGRAKAEVDAGESSLQSAVGLVERMLTLADQASTSTASASTMQNVAGEVAVIQQQLVSIAQTTVGGRFIFSGDVSQSPQYELDTFSPTGVSRQFTTSATRQIEDPAGGAFTVGVTAQDIFDARNADDSPASGNLFTATSSLLTALGNHDLNGVLAAAAGVRGAHDNLGNQLAAYGAMQNRLTSATDYAGKRGVELQTQISQKEDADIPTAVSELMQAITAQQAAMEAQAKMRRTSLFDYLTSTT
jgi:flagellar hook-associated protein 3 FlgL